MIGPVALLAAATALQAVGAIQQGQATKEQADFNAAIAERNAQISEQEADLARRGAAFEEAQLKRNLAHLRGAQAAAVGASGLSLEGSPLHIMAETAAEAELDALAIRFAGTVAE